FLPSFLSQYVFSKKNYEERKNPYEEPMEQRSQNCACTSYGESRQRKSIDKYAQRISRDEERKNSSLKGKNQFP
ncbi:MAG: hypothetical protein J5814_01370, partial [Bacteroidaceae bacterium]|nr:hypothetical protein [Bacteroidaceae bacterium]